MKVKPSESGNVSSLQWDSTVAFISPTDAITLRKDPDICTNFSKDTVTIAAWQEDEPWRETQFDVWDIYYSYSSGNGTAWSSPRRLTTVGILGGDVKVRSISDSSFVLIWNSGNVLLFSTFLNGQMTAPDTLAATNYDSTTFDLETVKYAPSAIAWTDKDSAGKIVCSVAQITNLNPVTFSQIDTISSEGDISNPQFVHQAGATNITFNVTNGKRTKAVLAYLAYRSVNDQSLVWKQQDFAADSSSDNFNVVGMLFPIINSSKVSRNYIDASSVAAYGLFGWEHRSDSDTNLIFLSSPYDTIESIGYNRNLVISSYSFQTANYLLCPFVWESNRTGRSHIYCRVGSIFIDAVNEPPHHDQSFVLQQNYPNPFNPTTTISYQLSVAGHATLKVYDVLGRLVTTLLDGKQIPGEHSVTFDARYLSSGVYFYQLKTGDFVGTKKMLVEK